MPYIAISAHKMLSAVASLRMAIDLLVDPAVDEGRRAQIAAAARSQLEQMETSLKELILAPRDLHTDPASGGTPADRG